MDDENQCEYCNDPSRNVTAEQWALIELYGWMTHAVLDGVHANFHTHGMPKTYRHLDLQIVVRLPGHLAQALFVNAIHQIEGGLKFKDGDISNEILDEYPVKFFETKECDRKVLRMILSDKEGQVDIDKLNKEYVYQYFYKT